MASIADIASETIKSSTNSKTLINSLGVTKDIIKEIIATDKFAEGDTSEFAKSLKGDDIADTCKNVWRFIRNNIKYQLDPIDYQYIKTPARTWHDKYGDCKSYSIFIGSILKNLNIPFYYRFVSFSSTADYTHVYIVALDENKRHVIIDACLPEFNTQKKFTFKKDYMTKIYRLSGIGAPAASRMQKMGFNVVAVNAKGKPMVRKITNFGSKDISQLTEAEMDLYIMKDRLLAKKSNIDKIKGIGSLTSEKYQDSIDMINDCIGIVAAHADGKMSDEVMEHHMDLISDDAINGVYSNASLISGIGRLATPKQMILARMKHRKLLANKRHTARVGKIKLGKFIKKVAKGAAKITKKVVNKVVQTAKKVAKAVVKVATLPARTFVKGLLEVGLPQVSPFFLYLFITNKDTIAKLPPNVKKKRDKALKIRNFICDKIGMRGDRFNALTRNGIIRKLGDEPEKILAKTIKGQINGIGFAFLAVIPILVKIIGKIVSLFGGKKEDVAVTADDAPDPQVDFQSDIPGLMPSPASSTANSDFYSGTNTPGASMSPTDYANEINQDYKDKVKTANGGEAGQLLSEGDTVPDQSSGGSMWNSLKS